METSINRLRIGHTFLTHNHLMKREVPLSITPLTVENLVTKCRTYMKKRQETGISNTMSGALHPDNIQQIVIFFNIFKLKKLL